MTIQQIQFFFASDERSYSCCMLCFEATFNSAFTLHPPHSDGFTKTLDCRRSEIFVLKCSTGKQVCVGGDQHRVGFR
jgi:hypothetical protein